MQKPVALPKLIETGNWNRGLKQVTDKEARADVEALGSRVKDLEKQYGSVPWQRLAANNWEAKKDADEIRKGRDWAKSQWKLFGPKLRKAGQAVIRATQTVKGDLKTKAPKEVDELIVQTDKFDDDCSKDFDDKDFETLLAKLGKSGAAVSPTALAKQKEKEEEEAQQKQEEKGDFDKFKRDAKNLVAPIKRLITALRQASDAGDEAVTLVKQIKVEYERRTGKYNQSEDVDKKLWNYKDQAKELDTLSRRIHEGHDDVNRRIDDMNSAIVDLQYIAARRRPDRTLLKEVNAALGFCKGIRDDCADLDRLESDVKDAAKTVASGKPPKNELKPLGTGKLIPDTNRLTRRVRAWQKMEPKTE
jgi:chromosome segregation ATPase